MAEPDEKKNQEMSKGCVVALQTLFVLGLLLFGTCMMSIR